MREQPGRTGCLTPYTPCAFCANPYTPFFVSHLFCFFSILAIVHAKAYLPALHVHWCLCYHSLVQWNWLSGVTECTWISWNASIDVTQPILLHQAVLCSSPWPPRSWFCWWSPRMQGLNVLNSFLLELPTFCRYLTTLKLSKMKGQNYFRTVFPEEISRLPKVFLLSARILKSPAVVNVARLWREIS